MDSFIKMHSAGNDYIYTFDKVDSGEVCVLCDRHKGIGADGVVRVCRQGANYVMHMFNADGSEGSFCGNATACVAKLLYDMQLVNGGNFSIYTRSGIKQVVVENGKKWGYVSVNVGKAQIVREFSSGGGQIISVDDCLDQSIKADIFEVNVGNSHLVVLLNDFNSGVVSRIRKWVKRCGLYQGGINIEFVVYKNGIARVKVCERGSGFTLACGSGAAAVFAVLNACKMVNKVLPLQFDGGRITAYKKGKCIYIRCKPGYCYKGSVSGYEHP